MCNSPNCAAFPTPQFEYNPEARSFNLLELAANDDLEGLRCAVEEQGARVSSCAKWYCRQIGSNKMASVERSPIMIAALFGNTKVMEFLLERLAANGDDVNVVCGADGASVLHCALSSGTSNVADVVQLLLKYGADPTLVSPAGIRSADAKLLLRRLHHHTSKSEKTAVSEEPDKAQPLLSEFETCDWKFMLPDSVSETSFEDLEELRKSFQDSGVGVTWSPKSTGSSSSSAETPEGLNDRAFDDIKSGIYATDEFRMYTFKVRPCSRAYSHDWTECPFAHPGENARRRDPRRFHYSCVPCPDFRKGACKQGDACEYAHGVFESWLHPAQYRTRLCKDGTSCTRKVCFFAHTKDEVRPLYMSSESGVGAGLSPCSSPSSVRSPTVLSGGMNLGPTSPLLMGSRWTQSGLPTLHLPERVTHPSKLRASLSARDLPLDKDLACYSAQARLNAAMVAASNSSALTPVRDRKLHGPGSLAASFEENMYGTASPRSPLQTNTQFSPQSVSQCHEKGLGNLKLEELIAAMASSGIVPPYIGCSQADYNDLGHLGMLGASAWTGKTGLPPSMSSRSEVGFLQAHSEENWVCSPTPSKDEKTWLNWGSPTGKAEWSVSGDDLARFRKSYSCKA